jgi:hypothetical protein
MFFPLICMCYYCSFADDKRHRTDTIYQTIVEGAKFGDSMVYSGKGNITSTNILVDSLSEYTKSKYEVEKNKGNADGLNTTLFVNVTSNISFAFKDKKIRSLTESIIPRPENDPEKEKYSMHCELVWDGEQTSSLTLDTQGKNGLIVPRGQISSDCIRLSVSDPLYYGMTVKGTSVSGFLTGEPVSIGGHPEKLKNFQYIGQKIFDGITCKVFSGKGIDSGNTIIVWIAPEQMYRPVYIEIVTPEGIEIIRNTYRKYDNGIWFPSKIVYENHYRDQKSHKRVLERQITLIIHDDFNINIDLPDSIFVMTYLRGMKVFDTRKKESFIIR